MSRLNWLKPVRLAIFFALAGMIGTSALVTNLPHRHTALLISLSAFLGWGTTWVAIWFLFHRIPGLPGTGVIPANKEAFFRMLAWRTRGLLDESGMIETVRAKMSAHLEGNEWKELLERRVDVVLDELSTAIRGLPEMIRNDSELSNRIKGIVYETVDDFGKPDRHVAVRQDLRKAVVAKVESLLPEVLKQLRTRIRKEIRDSMEEMGTVRRLLVGISGAADKMREAPTTLSDQIEGLIVEYVKDDSSMDEAIRRAIEGTAKSLRENHDLDPIVEKGMAAGSEAIASGFERGALRDRAREEILRRIHSEEVRTTITSSFVTRVHEFLERDLEERVLKVLNSLSDDEIEARFREIADKYFLYIELWSGLLGVICGVAASFVI